MADSRLIEPVTFQYLRPELRRGKAALPLVRTDLLLAMVQVAAEGGENNLHSHAHMDGFWFVLRGAARFYGEGDVVVAELGAHEGILIPRGFSYWFESAGDEPLELLQVEAFDRALSADEVMADRIDHAPQRIGTLIDGAPGEDAAPA
jgi:mannose-6-phosphate isomerase-like protein (cupin superfamily)